MKKFKIIGIFMLLVVVAIIILGLSIPNNRQYLYCETIHPGMTLEEVRIGLSKIAVYTEISFKQDENLTYIYFYFDQTLTAFYFGGNVRLVFVDDIYKSATYQTPFKGIDTHISICDID